MKTLEAMQNDFYQAIFQKKSTHADFVSSSHPAERLAIYKHTIFETLRNALAMTYPGIWVLLGEECSNNLAKAFCNLNENLPSSGCLDDWGDQFPDFINQQPALSHLSYLKDYAYYEWLKHKSYCAESLSSINAPELQSISEACIESVKFTFLPSVFTFATEFALKDIEAIVETPEANPLGIILKETYAIIARPKNTVMTFWIEADLWLFIHSLKQGLSLGQSFQATKDHYSEFELTKALHFLLNEAIIAKIILSR